MAGLYKVLTGRPSGKGNRYAEKIQTEEISLRGISGGYKILFSYFFKKCRKDALIFRCKEAKILLRKEKSVSYGKAALPFLKSTKGEKDNEEQQSDQCSSGT